MHKARVFSPGFKVSGKAMVHENEKAVNQETMPHGWPAKKFVGRNMKRTSTYVCKYVVGETRP